MSTQEKVVTIAIDELADLIKDSVMLGWLNTHGVANWCPHGGGYEDAMEDFYKWLDAFGYNDEEIVRDYGVEVS